MFVRKIFAQRFKNLRTEHNLSQNDVAKALNLTRGTVTHWKNEIRLPSLEVAIKLADCFNPEFRMWITSAISSITHMETNSKSGN